MCCQNSAKDMLQDPPLPFPSPLRHEFGRGQTSGFANALGYVFSGSLNYLSKECGEYVLSGNGHGVRDWGEVARSQHTCRPGSEIAHHEILEVAYQAYHEAAPGADLYHRHPCFPSTTFLHNISQSHPYLSNISCTIRHTKPQHNMQIFHFRQQPHA